MPDSWSSHRRNPPLVNWVLPAFDDQHKARVTTYLPLLQPSVFPFFFIPCLFFILQAALSGHGMPLSCLIHLLYSTLSHSPDWTHSVCLLVTWTLHWTKDKKRASAHRRRISPFSLSLLPHPSLFLKTSIFFCTLFLAFSSFIYLARSRARCCSQCNNLLSSCTHPSSLCFRLPSCTCSD